MTRGGKRSGAGRPRKPAPERKDVIVRVRLTADEALAVERQRALLIAKGANARGALIVALYSVLLPVARE